MTMLPASHADDVAYWYYQLDASKHHRAAGGRGSAAASDFVAACPRVAPGVADRAYIAGRRFAPGQFAVAGLRQSLLYGGGRPHASILAQLLLCGGGAWRRGERGQAAGRPMAASRVCFR